MRMHLAASTREGSEGKTFVCACRHPACHTATCPEIWISSEFVTLECCRSLGNEVALFQSESRNPDGTDFMGCQRKYDPSLWSIECLLIYLQ
jgi:hypothetical protein